MTVCHFNVLLATQPGLRLNSDADSLLLVSKSAPKEGLDEPCSHEKVPTVTSTTSRFESIECTVVHHL